ncbi:MAG: YitT family protein [Candidatus Faecivivens sp.]|nr:YitT family protein [Candidatus Faecivivens sp.]
MKKYLTKENLKEFLLLNAGTLLITLGVYFFKFPNNFSTGGVTGISIVLTKYFPSLSASSFVSILNIILLVIGFMVFGRGFGFKTAYSSLFMSAVLEFLQRFYPMSAPFTDQPLMELLFAVGLPAVGSAILFNIDASNGGTDIVAMIMKKYTSLDIGKSLMLSDLVITLLAGVAYGMRAGMFSMLGLIIKTTLLDSVMESFNMCKYFTIVTKNPDLICNFIIKELNRSATCVKGQGAFAHEAETIVLAVMTRGQAIHLRRFIRQNSPSTFMMITNTSEIIGKGFRGTN